MCTLKERPLKTRELRHLFPGMEQVSTSLSVTLKIRLLIHNICLPCRKKSKSFERVTQFRFLGETLINQNSFHEEINSRFTKWIFCYHLVHNFLSSNLLSEKRYKDQY